MIASILKLNRNDIKALRVTDDYSLHRVVYSLFEDIRSKEEKHSSVPSGILFADKGGDSESRMILLLSDRQPQTPQHGRLQSKMVGESFLAYDNYRFEVIINPTRRDSSTRKLIALRRQEEVAQWFIAKSSGTWGFRVNPLNLQVRMMQIGRFSKKEQVVTQGRAEISGELHVEDRSLFIKSFTHGIGRGRAFGFGLLQISPLKIQTNI